MNRLRQMFSPGAALVLFLPICISVWADANDIELSDRTVWGLGIWFVVVSGVNLSTIARQGGPFLNAVSEFQRSIENSQDGEE